MHYRTFLHKDCDKEVFGPLFSRCQHYLKVGTGGHAFITGRLSELLGSDAEYERTDLSKHDDWTGQELYEYVSTAIGDNEYMGAIETSEAQSTLMNRYIHSIAPAITP